MISFLQLPRVRMSGRPYGCHRSYLVRAWRMSCVRRMPARSSELEGVRTSIISEMNNTMGMGSPSCALAVVSWKLMATGSPGRCSPRSLGGCVEIRRGARPGQISTSTTAPAASTPLRQPRPSGDGGASKLHHQSSSPVHAYQHRWHDGREVQAF